MKSSVLTKRMCPLHRRQIAARAARDVFDGAYVNLGIGMPTLIADYVQPDMEVIYHSENGMLGMGPTPVPGEEDQDLVNAGKQLVTLVKGGCYFNSADSFAIMRGGHLSMVFLGAFQVSEEGDLANWITDDRSTLPSVGGAMDLAVGCRDIRVLMEHTTRDGRPRIMKRCGYPLTAKKVVNRIYTDLSVIDVGQEGLIVREMVEGMDFEYLQELTDAPLTLDVNWRLLDKFA
jgi:3-oxoadipate CoA-transferase, beta subunit